MEIATILDLVKDYGLANVLVVGVLIYLLKGKIDEITKAVSHVDKAVNNRGEDEITLSQEVSLIRKELKLFKKESISILKDFKLLRKEGYLVAGELKADIDHTNSNVKSVSVSTAELVKTIKKDVTYIKGEINAHREVDEKAFMEIKEDIKKLAS